MSRLRQLTVPFWTALLLIVALSPVLAGGLPPRVTGQPASISFFGANGYFTGYERLSHPGEVDALLPIGAAAGMAWTREEFSWANMEPSQWHYDWSIYDENVLKIANAGYGIIGMILTTPTWARLPRCAGNYWCPPANPASYGDFCQALVERYDGDGYNDAPGSPRVAYWEIWNEPNFQGTWPGTEAEYAALLIAGYSRIKAADPTAQVLVGSVYAFDGATDGLAWLSRVMLANPAACNAFDILGVHPHMPDVAPDQPGLGENVTMMSRLWWAVDWAPDPIPGCGPKPVWVTEIAWSTCTAGQGDCTSALSKTEDQQADYIIRTMAMARAYGIANASVFQLEDKFDGTQSKMWGGCALVKTAAQGYATKKAYTAYAVMVQQMQGTTYLGPGTLYSLQWDMIEGKNRLSAQSRFDFHFATATGGYLDILWRPDEQNETVAFSVPDGWSATWINRDGVQQPLTPSGGSVSVTINGHPGYLRLDPSPRMALSTTQVGFLARPSQNLPLKTIYIGNSGGGNLTWTATLSAGSEQWFAVEPTSGTAPGFINVRPLAPGIVGTYEGTLQVDAGDAGQVQVDLWMRVTNTLWNVYLPLTPQQ